MIPPAEQPPTSSSDQPASKPTLPGRQKRVARAAETGGLPGASLEGSERVVKRRPAGIRGDDPAGKALLQNLEKLKRDVASSPEDKALETRFLGVLAYLSKPERLQLEGVLRVPGESRKVQEIVERWDPEKPLLADLYDDNDKTLAAGTSIGRFLTKLNLFSDEGLVAFLQAGDLATNREDLAKEGIRLALHDMPKWKKNLLASLCEFCVQLSDAQSKREKAKLSLASIVTCLAPNFLRDTDASKLLSNLGQVQKALTIMIQNHKELFGISDEVEQTKAEKRSPVVMKDVFQARKDAFQAPKSDKPPHT